MILIASVIHGAIFNTSILPAAVARDKWLFVPISLLIFVPVAFIYIKLTERFPNDNLIQINSKIFGSFLGKTFSALYFIFFLLLFIINLRIPTVYASNNFLKSTTPLALAIIFLPLVVWAVKSGIEAIARISTVTIFISLLSIVVIFLLLMGKIEMEHLFPILDLPFKRGVQAINVTVSDILGEIMVLLICIPQLANKKDTSKAYLLGLSIGCACLMSVEFLSTCVLGNLAFIEKADFYQTTRQIELLNINARIEFVILGILILSNFVKITMIFYALVISAAYLFALKSYKVILIPFFVLSLGLFNLMFSSTVSQFEDRSNSWAFIALFFEIILPLITLIIAVIKKLPATADVED